MTLAAGAVTSVAAEPPGTGDMGFLTDKEHSDLRAAIDRAEAATSGEFVTVIAAAADTYLYIPILWAALAALLVPAFFELGNWPEQFAYPVQIGVFLALSVIVQWSPIKLRLIPRAVKRRRATRLAREQFITRGLHSTPNRVGVLLFVAVGERYVEILADQGIAAKVDNAEWQRIVDAFVTDVHADRIGEGFVGTVDACSAVMAQHFPPEPETTSLLPNNLIEISP